MGWDGVEWDISCRQRQREYEKVGRAARLRLLPPALRSFDGWTLIWRVRDEDRRLGWLSGRPAVAARCDAMRCDEQRKVVVVVEVEDEEEVESSLTTS